MFWGFLSVKQNKTFEEISLGSLKCCLLLKCVFFTFFLHFIDQRKKQLTVQIVAGQFRLIFILQHNLKQ